MVLALMILHITSRKGTYQPHSLKTNKKKRELPEMGVSGIHNMLLLLPLKLVRAKTNIYSV